MIATVYSGSEGNDEDVYFRLSEYQSEDEEDMFDVLEN